MENRELIKAHILEALPLAQVAGGGNEIAARCPFCGDSQNDRSKRSFYISFNEDSPMMYICFRASCGVKGMVTSEVLNLFGVYDIDTHVAILKENKKAFDNPINKIIKDREIYYLTNINNVEKVNSMQHKIKYIEDRIGVKLNINDLYNLKIVLSLIDLLKYNKITNLTRHPEIVKQLDKHFVGFISQDNAFINLRMITGEGEILSSIDKRYNIYNIFNKVNNKDKIYTIPTTIDLSNPSVKKLRISEGVFDILSVYYNLVDDKSNNIFTAVGGTGFLGVIKNYIINYKLINLEIHIYMDNDMDRKFIDNIVKQINIFNYPIFIHQNLFENEKDFGVPKDRIKENIIRLA